MKKTLTLTKRGRAGTLAHSRRLPTRSMSTTGRTISTKNCWTKFEEETGIKLIYDVFDSNDVLETKMLAGGVRI